MKKTSKMAIGILIIQNIGIWMPSHSNLLWIF